MFTFSWEFIFQLLNTILLLIFIVFLVNKTICYFKKLSRRISKK